MNICDECGKEFRSQESLEQHKKVKHPVVDTKKRLSDKVVRKIRNWSILIVIIAFVVGFIWYFAATSKTLPPISMLGHIEVSPPSHVMREPMLLEIQKHMLEHADGNGPPGVIINYNCKDYTCESGLIENLEAFAETYPTNVYVAPFPNMDAKIVLTRLQEMEILELYDKEKIDNFINRR